MKYKQNLITLQIKHSRTEEIKFQEKQLNYSMKIEPALR